MLGFWPALLMSTPEVEDERPSGLIAVEARGSIVGAHDSLGAFFGSDVLRGMPANAPPICPRDAPRDDLWTGNGRVS